LHYLNYLNPCCAHVPGPYNPVQGFKRASAERCVVS